MLDKFGIDAIPVFKNGKFAHPPENSDGISHFYNQLEILKDKKQLKYAETNT